MFRKYYMEGFSLNASFPKVDRREFGFVSFEGQMVRHKGFQSLEEARVFVQNFVPRDAYYSCAYYENPTAEMERKGWLGADLIFDIDADHIPTPCNKIHDEWVCCNCGFSGKGITPNNCPLCNGEKFETNTWLCQECLETAKNETMKLLDILRNDFGFSDKDIHVYFSGHRGYHVHIENEVVQSLDSISRKEIVDYVCGMGFNEKIGNSTGWHTRIRKGLYRFLLKAAEEDLTKLGLRRNIVKALLNNREKILMNLEHGEAWKLVKGVGLETWEKIFNHCAQEEFVKIDTVVTADIHRLVRLPDTLHGKTGFKKVKFPISQISDFDPFKEAIVFRKGTVNILVYNSPQFRIGEETFGPYKNVRVELPTAAALLLVCKGKAEVYD
ncbi:MAG: DNA primase small subunit PriS [Candidatus Bathyarchaeia archaeon]